MNQLIRCTESEIHLPPPIDFVHTMLNFKGLIIFIQLGTSLNTIINSNIRCDLFIQGDYPPSH